MAKVLKKIDELDGAGSESGRRVMQRSADLGPASESPRSLGSNAAHDLLATIHDRIIPQLIVVHAGGADDLGACPQARLPPSPEEVAAFARIAVAEDLGEALRFIEDMADAGLSLGVLLLDLVAPAARFLGDEWTDDRRSLTDVTAGLTLLHRVVHVLAPSTAPSKSKRGSVVLVAAPGEHHTLGIFLLAEFLRKESWSVKVDPKMEEHSLLDLVRREHIDMVGISVSNGDLVGPLTRLVSAVRTASLNADMAVMIGGSLVLATQAKEIGATFSNDPREAVALLALHAARRRRKDPSEPRARDAL